MAKRVLVSKFPFVVILALAMAIALPAALSRPDTARAVGCGATPSQPSDLYEVVSPPATNFQASAPAPANLTIHIKSGLELPAGFVSSALNWGDGSGAVSLAATPCTGSDNVPSYVWTDGTYTHPFAAPGNYQVAITMTVMGTSYPLLIVLFTVTPAAPTPTPVATPTPIPTAEATQQTTPAPVASATAATPGATQPPATLPPAVASVATTVPSPSPTGSPPPTATPSPAPTQQSASPTAAAGIAATASPAAPNPPPPTPGIQVIESLEAPDEISTDPAVVATNIVLAGVTVWVLFSSVVLNQVLQSNRDEIDRKTARLLAPVRRIGASVSSQFARHSGRGFFGSTISATAVLAFTGLIYSVLDPGFGWNRSTFTLFVSVVVGIGVVTYAYAGIEAAMTRRLASAAAAVRPYPAAIGIAVVSVVISRLLDFRPGVMYGFIASCALLAPVEPDRRTAGRIAASPTTVILGLSVVAWLLVQPLRSWYGSSGNWFAEVLEAAAVVIFVGGIESLFISMIPIAGMDGAKIFGWSRLAWIAFAVLSAFLAWHVLLGREQAYFSGLRQAKDMTVVLLFLAYTALTLGIWAYFRFRRPADATSGGESSAAIDVGGS